MCVKRKQIRVWQVVRLLTCAKEALLSARCLGLCVWHSDHAKKKLQYELKVVVEELEIAKNEHLKGFLSVSNVVGMV